MSESPEVAPVCYRHPDRETWIRCQRCDRPICPDCMRPAAVGFQCPSCVKEGQRSVRQPQAPYGGKRSGDPRVTTIAVIAVNIAIWLAIQADGGARSLLADRLSLVPDRTLHVDSDQTVTVVNGVAHGSWWQVLTSVFTQVSPWHIATNMIALFFVGPALEMVLGRTRFLALYLTSGLGGSAAVMLWADRFSPTLGASGAIFGLLGALAVVTHKVGGDWRNVLTWIGLNLVITFTIPNISWEGHLGGLVTGALIGAAFVYAPRTRRTLVQAAAVLALAVIAVGIIGLRAQSLRDDASLTQGAGRVGQVHTEVPVRGT